MRANAVQEVKNEHSPLLWPTPLCHGSFFFLGGGLNRWVADKWGYRHSATYYNHGGWLSN